MAGKSLNQAYQDNALQRPDVDTEGNVQQLANGGSKVLPGYNPDNPYTRSAQKARYLKEGGGPSEQMEQQAETVSDEKRLKEKSDDLKGLEEQAEKLDEQAVERAPDQPEMAADETSLERERRRVRQEMLEQAEQMDELHKTLDEKLDKALAAEAQRGKDLYAIENRKKNTLDYARSVYGDEADVDYIMDSAHGANVKASQKSADAWKDVNKTLKDIDQANKGDGKPEDEKDDDGKVTVMTPSGRVRSMDRDVAQAMEQYTDRSRGDAALEAAAAGYTQESDAENKYENFEFTRDEEEKLKELQRRMEENDKKAADFEAKAPQSMTQEEYQELRERRLKEYGDPSAGIVPDYVMTKEGVYTWNGRELPSAMSSYEMMEYQREQEGMGYRQQQKDQQYGG